MVSLKSKVKNCILAIKRPAVDIYIPRGSKAKIYMILRFRLRTDTGAHSLSTLVYTSFSLLPIFCVTFLFLNKFLLPFFKNSLLQIKRSTFRKFGNGTLRELQGLPRSYSLEHRKETSGKQTH